MTNGEMLKNVKMMQEMFPAFIEHYKKAAVNGNVDTWAKAIHSVIDLVAHDGQLICPHGLNRKECGLCHDEQIAASRGAAPSYGANNSQQEKP